MKDARWFGVGLVVFVGALDGCGVDHVVGSGTSSGGSGLVAGGAGLAGSGGAPATGGTGGDVGTAGSKVSGSGGTSGGRVGTSGTGGATMAGTGGNGASGGSAGALTDSGGAAGGGGSAGAALGGSGGSTTNAEGGAAGEEGGAGPGPIQCDSTKVRGTLTDSTGSTNIAVPVGSATITAMLPHPETDPYSLEFVLQTPDASEWHYNVTLPCLHLGPTPVGLPPELGVQAGDTVDIADLGGMTDFFSEHQGIALFRNGKLVVFTVDEAELDVPKPVDLSAYGFDVQVESISATPDDCRITPGHMYVERLVVTKDAETARVEESQTVVLGGFTFSIDQLSHIPPPLGGGADPPGWSRYGGFLMQP